MSEIAKDGKLSVKQGKIVVKLEAGYDGDKDGVKSVEHTNETKIDLGEALKEVAAAQDSESLKAIAVFVKQYAALLPDVEKDILD